MEFKIDNQHDLVVLDDGAIKIFRSNGDVVALTRNGTLRLAECLNDINHVHEMLSAQIAETNKEIEQLRALAPYVEWSGHYCQGMTEAFSELQDCQSKLAEANQRYDDLFSLAPCGHDKRFAERMEDGAIRCLYCLLERAEAQAQAAAMREALEKIAETSASWEGRSDAPHWNLGDIARAALAKTNAGADLLARLKAAEAVAAYATHPRDCEALDGYDCKCGFEDAMAAWRKGKASGK